jgi:hypothetical protein
MSQIFELIPKVMADIGAVAKTRKNEQQKYMFRGIEDLYQAAHPAMVKHGVFCAPQVMERTEYRYEKTNEYGKTSTWLHVALKICHSFCAPDGSNVQVITMGEGLDNSDKASNKAMSAAMKYALIELFCVPTADVEDSDRTTPEQGIKETIVLTPKSRMESVIEQAAALLPDKLPDEEFIDIHQKSLLSRRFRESVRPELEPEANVLRHSALLAMQESKLFRSQFVDDKGNPTQDLILKSEYASVGRELVKAAKSL